MEHRWFLCFGWEQAEIISNSADLAVCCCLNSECWRCIANLSNIWCSWNKGIYLSSWKYWIWGKYSKFNSIDICRGKGQLVAASLQSEKKEQSGNEGTRKIDNLTAWIHRIMNWAHIWTRASQGCNTSSKRRTGGAKNTPRNNILSYFSRPCLPPKSLQAACVETLTLATSII